ncbi:MAG: heparan-alpha-glucosaminide N-acetyltransferase domain-containing protein [Cyanobacteria bacterium P01_C01_bin.89]
MPLRYFTDASKRRLRSLDVFRGLAIASMILVNNPGSWSYVYPPLLHAEWFGFTPTDQVFPAFLFIAGASSAFALDRFAERGNIPWLIYGRIAKRVGLLLLLGLLLNGFPFYDLPNLRFMGVLQRIGLAYGLAVLVILNVPRLWQMVGAIALLFTYWVWLVAVPIPGSPGVDPLAEATNWVGYLDQMILGASHMYRGGPFDPEGLLSTLPAVVSVLMGYWSVQWLKTQSIQTFTSVRLAGTGAITLGLGYFWGMFFPVSKPLWTSSYVLVSGGWSLILLAVCFEIIDVQRWRSLGWPFEIMGRNAIAVFVGSGMVARILYRTNIGSGDEAPSTYQWLFENLYASWAGPWTGSILFAITTTLIWWSVSWFMYRQKWLLRV